MQQAKITNSFIELVNWESPDNCPYQINQNMDVWRVNVTENEVFIDDFLKVLSLSEIARASRYVRTGDRNRSVISRGALRVILGNYLDEPPQALCFAEGVNKKPRLDYNTGLFFNVSHSGDWILIAVAASEIGVDVEYINPGFEYQDVLEDYFVDEEIEFIMQASSTERFYMLWTRKEALSKGTAAGLDALLKYFPALDGIPTIDGDALSIENDWFINSFNISANYVASVVNDPSVTGLKFWNFELNFY